MTFSKENNVVYVGDITSTFHISRFVTYRLKRLKRRFCYYTSGLGYKRCLKLSPFVSFTQILTQPIHEFEHAARGDVINTFHITNKNHVGSGLVISPTITQNARREKENIYI